MKHFLLVLIALAIKENLSLADILRPEEKPFYPNAPITWAATNALPPNMVIYQTTNFSSVVLSNAMAIGSFKATDITSKNKDLIIFEVYKDAKLVRCLKISPTQNWMDYSKFQDDYSSIHGVPSYEEAEKLAVDYLRQFGYNTSQIISTGKPRTEGTLQIYDKKGGHLTKQAVYSRGITFYREIDGINMEEYFAVEFGNDADVTHLSMNWKSLQPYQRVKTASRDEIVSWIKAGRAMLMPDMDNGLAVLNQAKTLTITKAIPIYAKQNEEKFLYPSIELEITADIGSTNTSTFYISCPIIDETKP